eukprot:1135425-Amphidinium_carterae.1
MKAGRLELVGSPAEIAPSRDHIAGLIDVDDLKRAIKDDLGLTCPHSRLQIFSQGWEDVWQQQTRMDQVLYENTADRPYGFLVPAPSPRGKRVKFKPSPKRKPLETTPLEPYRTDSHPPYHPRSATQREGRRKPVRV